MRSIQLQRIIVFMTYYVYMVPFACDGLVNDRSSALKQRTLILHGILIGTVFSDWSMTDCTSNPSYKAADFARFTKFGHLERALNLPSILMFGWLFPHILVSMDNVQCTEFMWALPEMGLRV